MIFQLVHESKQYAPVLNRQRMLNQQKQPPEVFYRKGVLKNFAKFTGKHLC